MWLSYGALPPPLLFVVYSVRLLTHFFLFLLACNVAPYQRPEVVTGQHVPQTW